MDSVTQIALGASVAAAAGYKVFGKRTLLIGAALGTLPDLDVLINFGHDIDNYTYHRGFSHSLFVLTTLACALFLLCRFKFKTVRENSLRSFLLLWLPLFTHPLLDSFTTYGTQIWWPLSSPPVSWSGIFIVDPVYTLPLLITMVGLAFSQKSQKWLKLNTIALSVSCLYLTLGQAAKWQVYQQIPADMRAQGQLFISPTPFNIFAWRVLHYQDQQYKEALTRVLNPRPLVFQTHSNGRELLQGYHHDDLARLEWFSQGLLKFEVIDEKLQATDLRLGMTGIYFFSFIMAEPQTSHSATAAKPGNWKPLPPKQIAEPEVDLSKVRQLWRNMGQPDVGHGLSASGSVQN